MAWSVGAIRNRSVNLRDITGHRLSFRQPLLPEQVALQISSATLASIGVFFQPVIFTQCFPLVQQAVDAVGKFRATKLAAIRFGVHTRLHAVQACE